jgi:hypothetical protein
MVDHRADRVHQQAQSQALAAARGVEDHDAALLAQARRPRPKRACRSITGTTAPRRLIMPRTKLRHQRHGRHRAVLDDLAHAADVMANTSSPSGR